VKRDCPTPLVNLSPPWVVGGNSTRSTTACKLAPGAILAAGFLPGKKRQPDSKSKAKTDSAALARREQAQLFSVTWDLAKPPLRTQGLRGALEKWWEASEQAT